MSLSHNQKLYIGCFAVIAVMVIGTLAILPKDTEFGGTDGLGGDTMENEYGYKPWTGNLFEIIAGDGWGLPTETESMLFALQAAIGAIIIGYFIGLNSAAAKLRNKSEEDTE